MASASAGYDPTPVPIDCLACGERVQADEPCPGLLDPAAPCLCDGREVEIPGGLTVTVRPHDSGGRR